MKKSFNILLAFVIAFFAFPFVGQKASADGEVYDNIKDGTHDIKVKALKKGTDELSTAANYMDEKATLKVSNGQAELTLSIPKNDAMIFNKLELDGISPSIEDTGDSNAYTYQLKTVASKIPAVTTYEVPFIGLIHENVELDFELVGLDELPVVEEQPEEDGNNDESTTIDLANGSYTMDVSYLKADNDDNSSMGNYLGDSVFLSVEDGKAELTLTVTNKDAVTKLQVDGNDAIDKVVDGEKRYETFKLDRLDSIVAAYVEYQAPYNGRVFEGQADFRIALDEASIKSVNASDKPGADIESEPGKEKEDEDKDNNGSSDDEGKTPQKEPNEENLLTPDKAYEIDYVIKHEDGIQDSIANQFFTGKAILLEKDGKTYAQLTITSGEMIKELKNKYGKALIVKKNDDGSIVVQLRVPNDLSNMKLEMHVVVPAGAIPGFPGYDEKHTAILVFDKGSQKEIDVGLHKLVGSPNKENGNGPYTPGVEGVDELGGDENGEPSPAKPEFGNGADNGKTDNPKTGDTSKVLLYTLLLISSLIPLAFKLKRRYV